MFSYLIYFYFLVEEPSAVIDDNDAGEWVTVAKKEQSGIKQTKATDEDYLELF